MSQESAEGAQRGLERGIAELKAKYDRIAEVEAVQAEAKAAEARAAFRASAAGKAAEEVERLYTWACGRMDMPTRPHTERAVA